MRTCVLLAEYAADAPSVSIFDPASPAARSIVDLALLSLAVAALIFIIVEGVLLYSVSRFRRRHTPNSGEPPQVYGSMPIEVAWTAAPAIVVFFLILVMTRTLWEVKAAPVAGADLDQALEITVIGRQWWWELRYDRYQGQSLGFITAGELHMPASTDGQVRAVKLILESADVCHSFWAPRLAGKVDLIPGRTNELWLQTDEPGLYLGQCAEYCGTQHANMLLRVVVEPAAEFEQWIEKQKQPAAAPSGSDSSVFLGQTCVNCHRVRGTPAQGTYAPDLTHLMSRDTLASCIIDNNRENLERWVHDPNAIKPGCLMPAFGLDAAQEKAIVDYLLTLE